MALLNNFTTACMRNFQGDRLHNQLFFFTRALHKSAASETYGMSTAREGAMPERLIPTTDVGDKTAIKNLKDMPGPSTLSNLVEFFWRDGFSRIHEIQVKECVYNYSHARSCVTQKINSFCFPTPAMSQPIFCVSKLWQLCVKWHKRCIKVHHELGRNF